MVREERWRETTRMMVLQKGEQTGDYNEIQDHIETQKYNNHEGVPTSQKDRF